MVEGRAPDDAAARRAERLVAALVGGVALVAYALTAYRTVPGGDAGELIGAVASGGVIHPPGYPLYSLLGGAFLHLPLGSVALRLNLMSGVCDALAAAMLTLAVARSTRSPSAGAVTGALFAFAPGVWRYATLAEVFALNNLAIALLLWLAVLYDATRDRRYAYAGAFALGLGLSNHQTVLFTGVPVIVWALATGRRELLRPAVALRLVAAGAAGLLPYTYLPVAASHHAYVSWGAADTWDGFWTHVLRREYGTFRLAPEGVGAEVAATDVLGAWLRDAYDQLAASGLGLALVGVVACARAGWRRPRGLGLVVLAPPVVSVGVMMALGNVPVAQDLFREIIARFWQQPDLYLCVFAGVGFAALEALAPRVVGSRKVAPAVAAVLGLLQLGLHYRAMDRHANHLVEQYAAEMLRTAPEGALLVTKGDLITSSVRYLQVTARARPDVRMVDQELLATRWGRALFAINAPGVVLPGPRLSLDPTAGFSLKQLFDANHATPIMVCGGLYPGDRTADASYGLWPVGFCDDVHSGTEPVSLDEWLARAADAVPRVDFAGQAHPKGSWEDIVWSDYWEVRQARAAHLLQVAGANPARHKYLPIAAQILQQLVDENPDVPPHVHRNLAMAIGRAGIDTPAQKAQAARAWEGYLKVAPSSDPQLPAIREELERLRRTAP